MRCKSRTRPGLEVQKNRTEGSNLSPSATQSEVQRNPPGLLLKLRELGAIPHLLRSNRTGESVLLIAAGKLCSVFLRRASAQSPPPSSPPCVSHRPVRSVHASAQIASAHPLGTAPLHQCLVPALGSRLSGP